MLRVDLTTEGIVITGNRTKVMKPTDPTEPVEVPADEACTEVPADDPDRN